MTRGVFAAVTICGLVLVFGIGLASLDATEGWGGDFALYLAHARNLATGAPYADTGYLYTPTNVFIGPPAYPPGTAWLLAPAYAAFGGDLVTLKAVIVATFVIALGVLAVHFQLLADRTTALLAVLVVAVNPAVWDYADSVLSEMPFLLWLFVAFVLVDLRDSRSSPLGRVLISATAGAITYLAYATRPIAVLLLVAVALHDVVARRRLLTDLLPFLAVCLAGIAIQMVLLPIEAGYADHFALDDLSHVAANAWGYINALRGFYPLPAQIDRLVPVAMGVAAAYGFCLFMAGRLPKRAPSDGMIAYGRDLVVAVPVHVVFAAGYLFAIIVLPFTQGARYLLPLFPYLAFYAVIGVLAGLRWVISSAAVRAAIVAAAVAAYSIVHVLVVQPPGIVAGVHRPESAAMFAAVSRIVQKDGVVAFAKPRVMAYFAETTATTWPREATEDEAWQSLRALGVTHLVVARPGAGLDQPDFVDRYAEAPPPFLEPAYRNEHFVVFAVR